MYLPNPKRLRDWLSVPKSNGYESLHITVMGPEGKWVEVQIRTERMDEIAEKGLAAHWRYKGIKGESGLDEWLNSIRETLENADSDLEAMDQFKLDLYKDEVFVFTPKGDLYNCRKGLLCSTLLLLSIPIWDADASCQSEWKKCAAETNAQQWRPGRNNYFKHTNSEA